MADQYKKRSSSGDANPSHSGTPAHTAGMATTKTQETAGAGEGLEKREALHVAGQVYGGRPRGRRWACSSKNLNEGYHLIWEF